MSGGRPTRRLVVVGGGVTGLAAAWEATVDQTAAVARKGAGVPAVEVTVVESSPRLGGKVRTSALDLPTGPLTVDEGADNFLAREPEAVELCEELGLTDELTQPAAGRAAVWSGGRSLRWFPTRHVLGVPLDVKDLAATGIVSPAGLASVAAEVDCRDAPPVGDVGIGAFLADRFGDELVDHVVGPLVGGINAGDVRELSLRAVTPQLAAAADEGGSLTLALRRRVAANPPSGPVFRALRGGTGRLVATLADRLQDRGVDLRTDSAVSSLHPLPGGRVRVALSSSTPDTGTTDTGTIEAGTIEAGMIAAGTIEADAVVVATPAPDAARILAELDPAASALLAGITHVPVAFATLAVRHVDLAVTIGDDVSGATASGILVPRDAGLLVTAVSFGSSKWPHWNDGTHAILRVAVGHRHDDRPSNMDDDELLSGIRRDLATLLGLTAGPVATRVTRWSPGFAQYRVGHHDLVARVHSSLATTTPAVRVAGADLGGIGLPACIRQGRAATRSVLAP